MNFDLIVKEIDSAYRSLKHKLGWRFLCVSRHVLESNPRIALITANPGGDHIPIGHGKASCENGCAYLSEQWKNAPPGEENLQKQVQLLFETIARKTSFTYGFNVLMERSLIAYFIPFRSPRLAQLPRKEESIAFAKSLWSYLFRELQPKLIITIDPYAFRYMGHLLQQRIDALPARNEVSSTGWGNVKAETIWYGTDSNITSLVRLPHLSTFKLFSRKKCKQYTDAIIGRACEHF